MKSLFSGSAGALSLLLSGCTATVQVGGHEVEKALWERAQANVQERASFELKCPKEQLKLTLLTAAYGYPKQIGVDGCGHRLVYVASHSGWVLNSSDGQAK
jgi:hypothetical protein